MHDFEVMDRRSSSPEVLEELRERAVSLKKSGRTHHEIASILNIGHSTSRLYWKLYKAGGQAGIKLGKRGRPAGYGQKLNAKHHLVPQGLPAPLLTSLLLLPNDGYLAQFCGAAHCLGQ